MTPLHSFEFMDQSFVPTSVRLYLRDLVNMVLHPPFRPYYPWAVDNILEIVNAEGSGVTRVVELGAGSAPLARALLSHPQCPGDLRLAVSDLEPDHDLYRELEETSQGRIQPIYHSVDLRALTEEFGDGDLLVISAAFHHVPPSERARVLATLMRHSVVIIEPLQRTWIAVGLSISAPSPALMAPFFARGAKSRWRAVLWSWVVPIGPLLFGWDSVVSSLRSWTTKDWNKALDGADKANVVFEVKRNFLTNFIQWKKPKR